VRRHPGNRRSTDRPFGRDAGNCAQEYFDRGRHLNLGRGQLREANTAAVKQGKRRWKGVSHSRKRSQTLLIGSTRTSREGGKMIPPKLVRFRSRNQHRLCTRSEKQNDVALCSHKLREGATETKLEGKVCRLRVSKHSKVGLVLYSPGRDRGPEKDRSEPLRRHSTESIEKMKENQARRKVGKS